MHSKIKLPNPGDVVWFLNPDDSKMRPGVVLGVSKLKHEVIVAFGTSKKTHKLYPSEFLIAKTDGAEAFELSGLSHDTKFDLARTCILPFTTEFFAKAPKKNNIPFPKMGSVHIMYHNAMSKAKAKSNK